MAVTSGGYGKKFAKDTGEVVHAAPRNPETYEVDPVVEEDKKIVSSPRGFNKDK